MSSHPRWKEFFLAALSGAVLDIGSPDEVVKRAAAIAQAAMRRELDGGSDELVMLDALNQLAAEWQRRGRRTLGGTEDNPGLKRAYRDCARELLDKLDSL